MSAPVQVNCPECGNPIGEEIDINGITLFHAGGAVNREQRGWCAQCGTPFYWSASDTPMQLVISAMQILKGRLPIKDDHAE
jgi:endogenous inhibitor of DNA gyrase (YacG/DUF329 family)